MKLCNFADKIITAHEVIFLLGFSEVTPIIFTVTVNIELFIL